jgi:hypothetical protein
MVACVTPWVGGPIGVFYLAGINLFEDESKKKEFPENILQLELKVH